MKRLTAIAAAAILAAIAKGSLHTVKPGKPRSYYRANQPREVARRKRQIAAGTLQVTWPPRQPGPDVMDFWLGR